MAESFGDEDPLRSSAGGSVRNLRSKRSTRVVCTACRQSKVRCVGPDQDDCTRCARLNLECSRDAGFKRVSNNRKFADLEKQIQVLSSAVTQQTNPTQPSISAVYHVPSQYLPAGGSSGVSPSVPEVSMTSINGPWLNRNNESLVLEESPNQRSDHSLTQHFDSRGSTTANIALPEFPGNGPFHSPMNLGLSMNQSPRPFTRDSRSLESIQLDSIQIDQMFQIFFTQYHPMLPFLDISLSPDEYYKSSPLLFWAIIGVSSRRYRDDVTIFPILSDLVPKLMWTAVSRPPYTLSTAQAVITLCNWPFPVTSAWNDILITMSTIAISMAMQLGLHRPMNAQDFVRTNLKANVDVTSLRVRTCTWAAANVISHNIASIFGQLPNTPFDWTIDRACESDSIYTLSNELRFKVMIQHYCHRVSKLMCGDLGSFHPEIGNDRSMAMVSWANDLGILENELDTIESIHGQNFSSIDRLYFASARLYTHSMFFFDLSSSDLRKSGIMKAYNSAANFISVVAEADAVSDILLYITYYHIRMLLTAVCLVLKVSRSSYSREINNDVRKRIFNQGILLLSRCSVANNDTASKSGRLLSQMWHGATSTERNSPPKLLVKSRLGASLIYDMLWIWRQEFGKGAKTFVDDPELERDEIDPTMLPFENIFQDASMVNLDFLQDPRWNIDLDNPII